ncbi:MAG: mannose-1-phosphate guanylyltransferase [Kiritimatiellia bacterium]|jgi:mannose-1-phosphate guanylyltransferase
MSESKNLHAVIMAGGRGERFWPVSRFSRPKQFVTLFGGKPLLAIAVERLQGLVPPENVLIVTSADLVALSREALPEVPPENVLGEPFGRDTAAACALGTAWAAWKGGDSATVAVLTADHLIARPDVFRQTLRDTAALVAREGKIGVMGIVPQYPATGYGYLEAGAPVEGAGGATSFMDVKRFVEKPDEATAKQYVASGRHFWNSGMFLWSVGTFMDALKSFRPPLFEMAERMRGKFGEPDFDAALLAEYEKLDRISVDYAIMEKARNLVAARGDFGWDDVGTWVSAADHFEKVDHDNAFHGACEFLKASGNTVVNTEPDHLVAAMGVEDLVVVHTKDATLVCTRQNAQNLKELVRQVADKRGKQFV